MPPHLTFNQNTIYLDLAKTEAEKTQGLSGKKALAPDRGLLFVYQADALPGFWMKEMNFALDIIWLDKDWRVVSLNKNLLPNTFPAIFYPAKPIRYVLEVNAGVADKISVKTGDKVTASLE